MVNGISNRSWLVNGSLYEDLDMTFSVNERMLVQWYRGLTCYRNCNDSSQLINRRSDHIRLQKR